MAKNPKKHRSFPSGFLYFLSGTSADLKFDQNVE